MSKDILNTYIPFLDEFFREITNLGVNVNEFEVDHLGYYSSSAKDYTEKVAELANAGWELISEHKVSDRRVALLQAKQLLQPMIYGDLHITLVEIVEPMAGEETESRWEHVELVSDNLSLEDILAKYNNLTWDTSRLDRAEFPMLKLRLNDRIQAKFPRQGVLAESTKS